jgi:hypothetical protein
VRGLRFVLLRNQKDEFTAKLYEIGLEFFCIYFITAAIVFDMEHDVNRFFDDFGDALYW